MRRIPSLGRAAAAVAAAVVLSAASRDSAPQYYTTGTYYSSASHTTVVGGWKSCPPAEGGYSSWGSWSSYEVVTENNYAACELAE